MFFSVLPWIWKFRFWPHSVLYLLISSLHPKWHVSATGRNPQYKNSFGFPVSAISVEKLKAITAIGLRLEGKTIDFIS